MLHIDANQAVLYCSLCLLVTILGWFGMHWGGSRRQRYGESLTRGQFTSIDAYIALLLVTVEAAGLALVPILLSGTLDARSAGVGIFSLITFAYGWAYPPTIKVPAKEDLPTAGIE